MMLDWCRPIHGKKRINIVTHWIGRVFVFFILSGFTAFFTFQLIIELIWMTNIHKIILQFTWFMSYVSSLFVFIYYNLKRQNLLLFFEKWKQFEIIQSFNVRSSVDIVGGVKKKRLVNFMFVSYLLMAFGNLFSLCNMMKNEPEAPHLLSHYEILRNWLTVPLILVLHLIGTSLLWVLFALLDLVPAIVFYYTGKMLQCIEHNLQEDFESASYPPKTTINLFLIAKLKTDSSFRLRQTWLKYEDLLDLTGAANRTFGILMFLDHGIKFFLICCLTFMSLSNSKDFEIDKVATIFITIIFIYRFVSCLLISAELHNSSSKLKGTASSLLSRNCHKMSKEERDLTVLFINRLQDHQLAARPLGLYGVSNSILLSILSLTVSYVIILVQIK